MVPMLSQMLLSQISMLIEIFITVKESFFWKGVQQWIQQFELPRRQIKDTWYLESATAIPIGILSCFFFRISEKYLWKRSVLDNVTSYMPADLLKENSCSFLKDFACRFSWQNYYRTTSLQRTFSIITLPPRLRFMSTIQ